MTRVHCWLTHLAGCVGRPATPSHCCTSGDIEAVEHVL
jgi:hypothetical protein